MARPAVPDLGDIDTAFLSEMLSKVSHAHAEVLGFSQQAIGTGQMARCIRFELDGAHDPRTLIGKFPSEDPASRQAGANGPYAKEVVFYRDLASQLSIATPDCYFAAMTDDGSEFALIMADMAPAQQGDQLRGCSPDMVERAARQLVGLHAPTWNNAEFFARTPVLDPSQAIKDATRIFYNHCLAPFVAQFRGWLAPEQVALFEKLGETTAPCFTADLPVVAMVHGDFRLDNLLIDTTGADPTITTVDWQTYGVGNPLSDVTYLVATSLSVDERRAHEQRIVKSYHQGLLDAGVPDFTWEDCWTEYRRAAFSGFPITVIAAVSVEQTPRGDQMFRIMAERTSRQALDLGSEEFLA